MRPAPAADRRGDQPGDRFGGSERDDLDLVGPGDRGETGHVGESERVGHRVAHPAGHRVEVAVRDDEGDAGA